MAIEKELLDRLLAGRDSLELFAKVGLLDDPRKALSDRILNAELMIILRRQAEGLANRRNGHSKKTVLTARRSSNFQSRVTVPAPSTRS